MATHAAALVPAVGQPLTVEQRPTPKPGPGEVLIEVKAVAMNIVDAKQRDLGFMIPSFPAILGSDVSGVVVEAGSDAGEFTPGTRVLAFASGYFYLKDPTKNINDYGAFQAKVLVDTCRCCPLPDSWSFNDGVLIPMTILTGMSGWQVSGVAENAKYSPQDKQAVFVWGASSAVGSLAVQIAKIMGFSVYATASPQHHDYIKSLGATRMFDYRDEKVVDKMVEAAKEDGLTFNHAYYATGSGQQAVDAFSALRPEGKEVVLAWAPPLPQDPPKAKGVTPKFVSSSSDPNVFPGEHRKWYNVFAKDKIASGEIVPSPKAQLVPGGISGINEALNMALKGVSCAKLVVEL